MARKEYKAQDGYTFMKGNIIIGKTIYLGTNDKIESYKEVRDEDLPKEDIGETETKEG